MAVSLNNIPEAEKELDCVDGIIEHVVYHNDDNGYSVCDLSTDDGECVTVVGIMSCVSVGESITAYGKWETHSTYGKQFKIDHYEKQLPFTKESILKYLSSGAIKGIGPSNAKKIVQRYGTDTFEVLENHPEWLAELPGITENRAKKIGESYAMQFGMRNVMMFCRDFFGTALSVKIYKRWGASAVDIIKEDPYVLCDEIHGISFEKADRVAMSLGVKKNSSSRLCAAIKFMLSANAAQNGHVYLPADRLIPAVVKMLDVSSDETESAFDTLCEKGDLKIRIIGGRECVYLKEYYIAEKYSAEKLDLLAKTCPVMDTSDVERIIGQMESEEGISYAPMQKKAIRKAVNSGVMILTGGPGTGKTTVVRAILRIFEYMGLKVALAAPTGRAAKRMSEATSNEAKTIHRLLEMEYGGDAAASFKRNETALLEENAVIIDEASMIDTLLLEALLRAIKPGARLIIIGDSDQLPSVGAGNVLCDLIASDHFDTVKLKEIFRQESESLIVTNAHAINNGEYPVLKSKDNDFFFIARDDDNDIAMTVADLCKNRLPKKYGEGIKQEIQVITPSHNGGAGTVMLNALLQQTQNPKAASKNEKKVRDIIFREGDKVMQIRNNYDIMWKKGETEGVGIFNGDIGTILEIDNSSEIMIINFDERICEYDFAMLDELEHSYAITVHKSQGSEYPVVILPMYRYSPKLLTRNLLYTAVTRAQRMVIMVGNAQVVSAMVDNNRLTKRYTGLSQMLAELSAE